MATAQVLSFDAEMDELGDDLGMPSRAEIERPKSDAEQLELLTRVYRAEMARIAVEHQIPDVRRAHEKLAKKAIDQGMRDHAARMKAHARQQAREKDAPQAQEDPRTRLTIDARNLPAGVDALTALLADPARCPELYVRRGELAMLEEVDGEVRIRQLAEDTSMLKYYVGSRVALLEQRTKDGQTYSVPAKNEMASDVLSQALSVARSTGAPGGPSYRQIDRVLECPTIDRRGEIIAAHGYHPNLRIYLSTSLDIGTVPDMTPAEARAAYRSIRDELFGEFTFDSDCASYGRSFGMMMLLTALAAPGLECKAPAYVVTSAEGGSGKTHMVDIVGHVATGQRFIGFNFRGRGGAAAMEKSLEALQKQIETANTTGKQFFSIDNWATGADFGDSALAASLTSDPTSAQEIRKYRTNDEMLRAHDRLIYFVTGCNLRIAPNSEMERRIAVLRLGCADANRDYRIQYGGAAEYMATRRAAIVRDCLAMLRTYIRVGRGDALPIQGTLGSYGTWDTYLRRAVCWLEGDDAAKADPYHAIRYARRRLAAEADSPLLTLLYTWDLVHGSGPEKAVPLRDLLLKPNALHKDDYDDLVHALREFAPHTVDKLTVDAKLLSLALRPSSGRRIGPYTLTSVAPKSRKDPARWELTADWTVTDPDGNRYEPPQRRDCDAPSRSDTEPPAAPEPETAY